jgi:hypothetical protein
MNKNIRKGPFFSGLAIIAASTILAGPVLCSQQYIAAIAQFQPPNYNVDCVWFTLVGVAQADPILPNNPWFGLPRTQIGYSEMYAVLLAAKLGGSTLTVTTTGAVAGGSCGGYAGIAWIVLQ